MDRRRAFLTFALLVLALAMAAALRAAPLSDGGLLEDVRNPEIYLPLLFTALLMLFLGWLFGPAVHFLKACARALREKPSQAPVEPRHEPFSDVFNRAEKPEESPAAAPAETGHKNRFEPFACVNEDNVRRLACMFMLRKENPRVIAVVAGSLKPKLARGLLTALPADLRAKVAVEALVVRQMGREQIMALDADIAENIDFVVGGIAPTAAMLEDADAAVRDDILAHIRTEKPALYEGVRRRILLFEDLADFPDREMQSIVRELKTQAMARALQGAAPAVCAKFFSNLSAGAAALLKESMESAQGLDRTQIEEERVGIMDVVKALDRQGRIGARNRAEVAGGDIIESGQEQPGADPEQARAYYDAAIRYYHSGPAEAAVPYFEAALQLDPSFWQAHQYLGGLLYHQGRVAEAMEHYEKILQYNPDPELKTWLEESRAKEISDGRSE